jgi:hypothetical protein
MKKAQISGEMIIWLYRFLLIIAISFALVIIIGNKYTSKYDVRHTESIILSSKLADCLSDLGKYASQISLKECLGIDELNYYILVNLTSFDSNFTKEIFIGNSNLKVQCDLVKGGTEFAKYPSCSNFNYLLIMDDEKIKSDFEIDIGKHDKNLQ